MSPPAPVNPDVIPLTMETGTNQGRRIVKERANRPNRYWKTVLIRNNAMIRRNGPAAICVNPQLPITDPTREGAGQIPAHQPPIDVSPEQAYPRHTREKAGDGHHRRDRMGVEHRARSGEEQ